MQNPIYNLLQVDVWLRLKYDEGCRRLIPRIFVLSDFMVPEHHLKNIFCPPSIKPSNYESFSRINYLELWPLKETSL